MTICASCGKEILSSVFHGDEGTFLVQLPLCHTCFNAGEVLLTIIIGDDGRQPLKITKARNHTGGQFLLGRNESLGPQVRSDSYVRIYSSVISKREEWTDDMMRAFDKDIRRAFKENNIAYAKVFVHSPEEYYKDYELWVKSEHIQNSIRIIHSALAKTSIIIPPQV